MNKKILRLISLLLSVCLLSGCGGMPGFLLGPATFSREDYAARELCRFSEMPYERPDLDAMRDQVEQIRQALDGHASYRKVAGLLDEFHAMGNTANTMATIANIRNCQNLTDSFYAEEYAWCSAALVELSQIVEELYMLCGRSRLAGRLERNYFWEGFLEEYGPESERVYTDEYVALAAQESELVAEYRSLVANPVIEIDGEEWFFSDWVYNAADNETLMRGYDAYYDKYNPVLGALYIRLVKLRREMAATLGYNSYAEMQFELNLERDYSVAESDRFIDDVREILVPVFQRVQAAGVWDRTWFSRVSEQDLWDALEATAAGLGEETQEAYAFMTRYELCDISVSDDKPSMSFQTYLKDYEAPYLFASPRGDTQDILTVTHEFGHYVESFSSYDYYRSLDLAECFSQAMQYLALEPMRAAFADEEIENLRLLNLLDSLETYVQQCSFAAFEREAFSMEEPSVEALNALSLKLAAEYGYYDGVNQNYYSKSWIDTPHFFEQPFYVISYPASAGVALEIYEMEEEKPGAGYEMYQQLIDAEASGIMGAATEAGLHDPLSRERVQEIARFFEQKLLGYSSLPLAVAV